MLLEMARESAETPGAESNGAAVDEANGGGMVNLRGTYRIKTLVDADAHTSTSYPALSDEGTLGGDRQGAVGVTFQHYAVRCLGALRIRRSHAYCAAGTVTTHRRHATRHQRMRPVSAADRPAATAVRRPWHRKHVPEAQRLVAGAGHHHCTVRTHRQIQHPQQMSGERGHLAHARIPPQNDLILRVPVRAHQLVQRLAPRQIAHLRAGVHRVQRGAGGGVPEPNAAVGGAAAAGQQSVLMR
eukprot:ctg_900.g375